MDHLNISTLYDLSSWTYHGRWAGWIDLEILDHLLPDYNALHFMLHRLAPVHCNWNDRIGCGKSGSYYVKEGYRAVDGLKNSSIMDKKWNKFWCGDEITKINAFF